MTSFLVPGFIVMAASMLAACGESDRGALCTAGTQRACTCPDGLTMGLSTCQTDGSYGLVCDGCGTPAPMVKGDKLAQYVLTQLTLPTSASVAAYDIDGDGMPDNRLGSILQAIASLDLNAQASTDEVIDDGSLVLLLEELSTDPTQQNATDAGVRITRGLPTATVPRFDGTDVFMLDPSEAPDQLVGDIVAGVFTSKDPASSLVPIELTLVLPIIGGAAPVPVTAARMTFQRGAGGKLTAGQLNGAIRKSDVDAIVLPAVASLLTTEMKKPGALPAIASFDTDGNGTVTGEELRDNALIQSLLAPDVAIFGTSGSFDPNPSAPDKDCLSLGVQFDAVGASF